MKYLFGILVLCCYLQITFAQESKESSVEIKPEMLLSVPAKISYQGVLTENGLPITGQRNMEFSLYDAITGDTLVWTETQNNIDVDNGIFNVLLGEANPLTNISFDRPYYLEIRVNNNLLNPRIELTSSAYSFNTARIQGKFVSENSPTPGQVLKWTGSQWEPEQDNSGGPPSGPAGGDLDGTYPEPMVVGIRNKSISAETPSINEVLKWTGSHWEPAPDEIGGFTLPFTGSTTSSSPALRITNNGENDGIQGRTFYPQGIGVKGEYLGGGENDGIGILGSSVPEDWFGYGGIFEGGYIGASGKGFGGTANGIVYGVYGSATGTAGSRYGVFGTTSGSSPTRRAGYFNGDLQYTGSLIGPSDNMLNKDIRSIENAVTKIMKIQPHSFMYKDVEEFRQMNLPKGIQYGLIAQELEKIFPELIVESVQPLDLLDDKTTKGKELKYKGVKYIELIPVLIQAIKEQQEMIEALRSEVRHLKTK